MINVNDVDISNRDTDVMYYEKNRENISYEMNESELERYHKNILLQQKNEERRMNRLQNKIQLLVGIMNYYIKDY